MNRIERYRKTRAYLKLAFRTLREGCKGCDRNCIMCGDTDLESKIIRIYSKIGSKVCDLAEQEAEDKNG